MAVSVADDADLVGASFAAVTVVPMLMVVADQPVVVPLTETLL